MGLVGAWAAAGATGWDYASMLPFLERVERVVGGGDLPGRGRSGPVTVAAGYAEEPLWDAMLEAAVEAGHLVAADLDSGAGEGGRLERVHRGERFPTPGSTTRSTVVSTNTCATVFAIAERAAALITGQRPLA